MLKIGCGGHLVFQKLLKFNTSQAYVTLYLYTKFGDDIFITFPLIDRTSSKCWEFASSVKAAILFQFDRSKKQKLAKYYDYSPSRDNSSNGIAVIGQTIFVENWLWRPSCFSEIAENQYQPSLCHLYIRIKSLVMIYS